MKKAVEDEYDNVTAYNEFSLGSDGRTWRKQELNYTNKFELGDMVKIAGNNLLVSVPGLMGDQLFVAPDDRKREVDAYMSYPLSLIHI